MTDTQPRVALYYSYRGPYSYLAIGRLKGWAEAEGIRIALLIWRVRRKRGGAAES